VRYVVGAVTIYLVYLVVTATFERLAPRRWVRAYQRAVNPFFRLCAGVALGFGVIETTGRRTGLRRQTPVGGRLRGDSFWCVAGDGAASSWVMNIESEPRVRVKVHGRWRTGTAHLLLGDDARRRLWRLNPLNSLFVGIAARDPLTVRIDLCARSRVKTRQAPT
jgi:deazaflavin-dependent oxidoreductase (nitroreductase family)